MGFDIGQVVNTGRRWVGDAMDKVDEAKNQVGSAIDGAVHEGEKKLDQFRGDMVDFGQRHGGVVGGTLARMASDQIGLTEGAALAVYDMGKGVVQLADGLGKVTNPLEWAVHGDQNLLRVETAAVAGAALGSLGSPAIWVTNPQANLHTAKTLFDGVTQGYQDAAHQGDYSKFAGRLVVDVGSLFIGVGEANAGIKGAQGASAVAKVGEGAGAVAKASEGASAVAKAAEGVNASTKVADAVSASSKVAEGTSTAGKLGDAGATVKGAVQSSESSTAAAKGIQIPTPTGKGASGFVEGPHVPGGHVPGLSTQAGGQGIHHPVVQAVYDSVPPSARSFYHGKCVEADALSELAKAGGAKSIDELKTLAQQAYSTVYNSKGTYLPPCQSCKQVLEILGIGAKK